MCTYVCVSVCTQNKAKSREREAQKSNTLCMKIPIQTSVTVCMSANPCALLCVSVCVCVPRCAYVLIGSSHRAADGSIKEPLNGLALVNS